MIIALVSTGCSSPLSLFQSKQTGSKTGGKPETVVTGLSDRMNVKAGTDKASQTLKITPANGSRKVSLQLYNSKTNAYQTVSTTVTADTHQDTVQVKFPKKYLMKTNSKWRIVIPESKSGSSYVSQPVSLVAYNTKKLVLPATNVCVYRVEDGQMFYALKENKKVRQASTTKIMSAVVALESNRLANGKTVISEEAICQKCANMRFKPGEVYKNMDLLYAMMLPSSNDSAYALAEGISGSFSEFISAMNQKAFDMGFQKTHYQNASGLDVKKKNQGTTAKELSKLMGYAYQNPLFRKILMTKKYKFTSVDKTKEKKEVYTTDKLLGSSKEFRGGKTGYTDLANFCFCSVYKIQGKTYVISVLGSGSTQYRFMATEMLYHHLKQCLKSTW